MDPTAWGAPGDGAVRVLAELPSSLMFQGVMTAAKMGKVVGLRLAAKLPVDAVVDIAALGEPAAPREPAGLVPES